MIDGWPAAGLRLMNELAQQRGRLALVRSDAPAVMTLTQIAALVDEKPTSVGRLLTHDESELANVERLIADAKFLSDCDILFWPTLRVEPLTLLRSLARRRPRIAVWPGVIEGNRVTYSQPGRQDWYEGVLTDTLVLKPRPTTYPDDVPYTEERIP